MSTELTKQAYTDLINGNIEELEKYMPKHSLEKKHTIAVLEWSIEYYYDNPDIKKARADERNKVIEEIEKEISNLKPEYAINQISIWLLEQKSKLELKEQK